MSLYREARPRRWWPVGLAAVLGAAAGLVVALVLAASDDEPDLAEAVEALREDVRPAIGALELVEIEYTEAVRRGNVVAESEYEAARSSLEQARASFEAARADLELLDPAATEQAAAMLARLDELIGRRAYPPLVENLVGAARAEIARAARLESEGGPRGRDGDSSPRS